MVCHKCKIEKDNKEFYDHCIKRNDYICKKCVYQRSKISRIKNHKNYKQYYTRYNREHRLEFNRYRKEWRKRNPVKDILYSVKCRAKKFNIEFDIDETDLIIPKICPLLEIPIILSNNTTSYNSPSVDRIDNAVGYIKGNVRIISHKANVIKNCASNEEFALILKNWYKI